MGAVGRISVQPGTDGGPWVARSRFSDVNGVTRWVERSGPSRSAAIAALQDELRRRAGALTEPLRPHNTFERAAQLWLAMVDAQVAEGIRAATTADAYRQSLRSVILPAMGRWHLIDITASRLDDFFRRHTATQGPHHTVVFLILRLAVQHKAIHINPVAFLEPS